MHNRFIGGIMLVIGTSIGGGMLALPVSTAVGGFIPGLFLLLACWLVMLLGALYLLEVNLWLPENSNLISMAGATLGRGGKCLTWIVYVLLLYALMSLYIAAGSQITQALLQKMVGEYWVVPSWLASVIFTIVMGYIVYRGIVWVDLINRGLLSSKMLACLLLIVLLSPYVTSHNLMESNGLRVLGATTVVMTSFGFSTIVPSLRAYFKSDVRKLRLAIILGSAIPLCFYIAWSAVVQGIVSIHDSDALSSMSAAGNVTTHLAAFLAGSTKNFWIDLFAHFFVSVCVLTSFLGVALCLNDFLADGFKVVKAEHAKKIALGAFIPPLILVLFIPSLFIKMLGYAGILCLILLALLPAMMAYSGRYVKAIALGYRVAGGRVLLIVLMGLAFVGMGLDVFW